MTSRRMKFLCLRCCCCCCHCQSMFGKKYRTKSIKMRGSGSSSDESEQSKPSLAERRKTNRVKRMSQVLWNWTTKRRILLHRKRKRRLSIEKSESERGKTFAKDSIRTSNEHYTCQIATRQTIVDELKVNEHLAFHDPHIDQEKIPLKNESSVMDFLDDKSETELSSDESISSHISKYDSFNMSSDDEQTTDDGDNREEGNTTTYHSKKAPLASSEDNTESDEEVLSVKVSDSEASILQEPSNSSQTRNKDDSIIFDQSIQNSYRYNGECHIKKEGTISNFLKTKSATEESSLENVSSQSNSDLFSGELTEQERMNASSNIINNETIVSNASIRSESDSNHNLECSLTGSSIESNDMVGEPTDTANTMSEYAVFHGVTSESNYVIEISLSPTVSDSIEVSIKPEERSRCDNQGVLPDSCLVDEFVRADGLQKFKEDGCPPDSVASAQSAESDIINWTESSAGNSDVSISEDSGELTEQEPSNPSSDTNNTETFVSNELLPSFVGPSERDVYIETEHVSEITLSLTGNSSLDDRNGSQMFANIHDLNSESEVIENSKTPYPGIDASDSLILSSTTAKDTHSGIQEISPNSYLVDEFVRADGFQELNKDECPRDLVATARNSESVYRTESSSRHFDVSISENSDVPKTHQLEVDSSRTEPKQKTSYDDDSGTSDLTSTLIENGILYNAGNKDKFLKTGSTADKLSFGNVSLNIGTEIFLGEVSEQEPMNPSSGTNNTGTIVSNAFIRSEADSNCNLKYTLTDCSIESNVFVGETTDTANTISHEMPRESDYVFEINSSPTDNTVTNTKLVGNSESLYRTLDASDSLKTSTAPAEGNHSCIEEISIDTYLVDALGRADGLENFNDIGCPHELIATVETGRLDTINRFESSVPYCDVPVSAAKTHLSDSCRMDITGIDASNTDLESVTQEKLYDDDSVTSDLPSMTEETRILDKTRCKKDPIISDQSIQVLCQNNGEGYQKLDDSVTSDLISTTKETRILDIARNTDDTVISGQFIQDAYRYNDEGYQKLDGPNTAFLETESATEKSSPGNVSLIIDTEILSSELSEQESTNPTSDANKTEPFVSNTLNRLKSDSICKLKCSLTDRSIASNESSPSFVGAPEGVFLETGHGSEILDSESELFEHSKTPLRTLDASDSLKTSVTPPKGSHSGIEDISPDSYVVESPDEFVREDGLENFSDIGCPHELIATHGSDLNRVVSSVRNSDAPISANPDVPITHTNNTQTHRESSRIEISKLDASNISLAEAKQREPFDDDGGTKIWTSTTNKFNCQVQNKDDSIISDQSIEESYRYNDERSQKLDGPNTGFLDTEKASEKLSPGHVSFKKDIEIFSGELTEQEPANPSSDNNNAETIVSNELLPSFVGPPERDVLKTSTTPVKGSHSEKPYEDGSGTRGLTSTTKDSGIIDKARSKDYSIIFDQSVQDSYNDEYHIKKEGTISNFSKSKSATEESSLGDVSSQSNSELFSDEIPEKGPMNSSLNTNSTETIVSNSLIMSGSDSNLNPKCTDSSTESNDFVEETTDTANQISQSAVSYEKLCESDYVFGISKSTTVSDSFELSIEPEKGCCRDNQDGSPDSYLVDEFSRADIYPQFNEDEFPCDLVATTQTAESGVINWIESSGGNGGVSIPENPDVPKKHQSEVDTSNTDSEGVSQEKLYDDGNARSDLKLSTNEPGISDEVPNKNDPLISEEPIQESCRYNDECHKKLDDTISNFPKTEIAADKSILEDVSLNIDSEIFSAELTEQEPINPSSDNNNTGTIVSSKFNRPESISNRNLECTLIEVTIEPKGLVGPPDGETKHAANTKSLEPSSESDYVFEIRSFPTVSEKGSRCDNQEFSPDSYLVDEFVRADGFEKFNEGECPRDLGNLTTQTAEPDMEIESSSGNCDVSISENSGELTESKNSISDPGNTETFVPNTLIRQISDSNRNLECSLTDRSIESNELLSSFVGAADVQCGGCMGTDHVPEIRFSSTGNSSLGDQNELFANTCIRDFNSDKELVENSKTPYRTSDASDSLKLSNFLEKGGHSGFHENSPDGLPQLNENECTRDLVATTQTAESNVTNRIESPAGNCDVSISENPDVAKTHQREVDGSTLSLAETKQENPYVDDSVASDLISTTKQPGILDIARNTDDTVISGQFIQDAYRYNDEGYQKLDHLNTGFLETESATEKSSLGNHNLSTYTETSGVSSEQELINPSFGNNNSETFVSNTLNRSKSDSSRNQECQLTVSSAESNDSPPSLVVPPEGECEGYVGADHVSETSLLPTDNSSSDDENGFQMAANIHHLNTESEPVEYSKTPYRASDVKTGESDIINRIESSVPDCDEPVSANPDVPKTHRRESIRKEIKLVDTSNSHVEEVAQERVNDDGSGTSELKLTTKEPRILDIARNTDDPIISDQFIQDAYRYNNEGHQKLDGPNTGFLETECATDNLSLGNVSMNIDTEISSSELPEQESTNLPSKADDTETSFSNTSMRPKIDSNSNLQCTPTDSSVESNELLPAFVGLSDVEATDTANTISESDVSHEKSCESVFEISPSPTVSDSLEISIKPDKGSSCDYQDGSPDSDLADEFLRADGRQKPNEDECPYDLVTPTQTAESDIINLIESSGENGEVSVPEISDVQREVDASNTDSEGVSQEKLYDDENARSDLKLSTNDAGISDKARNKNDPLISEEPIHESCRYNNECHKKLYETIPNFLETESALQDASLNIDPEIFCGEFSEEESTNPSTDINSTETFESSAGNCYVSVPENSDVPKTHQFKVDASNTSLAKAKQKKPYGDDSDLTSTTKYPGILDIDQNTDDPLISDEPIQDSYRYNGECHKNLDDTIPNFLETESALQNASLNIDPEIFCGEFSENESTNPSTDIINTETIVSSELNRPESISNRNLECSLTNRLIAPNELLPSFVDPPERVYIETDHVPEIRLLPTGNSSLDERNGFQLFANTLELNSEAELVGNSKTSFRTSDVPDSSKTSATLAQGSHSGIGEVSPDSYVLESPEEFVREGGLENFNDVDHLIESSVPDCDVSISENPDFPKTYQREVGTSLAEAKQETPYNDDCGTCDLTSTTKEPGIPDKARIKTDPMKYDQSVQESYRCNDERYEKLDVPNTGSLETECATDKLSPGHVSFNKDIEIFSGEPSEQEPPNPFSDADNTETFVSNASYRPKSIVNRNLECSSTLLVEAKQEKPYNDDCGLTTKESGILNKSPNKDDSDQSVQESYRYNNERDEKMEGMISNFMKTDSAVDKSSLGNVCLNINSGSSSGKLTGNESMIPSSDSISTETNVLNAFIRSESDSNRSLECTLEDSSIESNVFVGPSDGETTDTANTIVASHGTCESINVFEISSSSTVPESIERSIYTEKGNHFGDHNISPDSYLECGFQELNEDECPRDLVATIQTAESGVINRIESSEGNCDVSNSHVEEVAQEKLNDDDSGTSDLTLTKLEGPNSLETESANELTEQEAMIPSSDSISTEKIVSNAFIRSESDSNRSTDKSSLGNVSMNIDTEIFSDEPSEEEPPNPSSDADTEFFVSNMLIRPRSYSNHNLKRTLTDRSIESTESSPFVVVPPEGECEDYIETDQLSEIGASNTDLEDVTQEKLKRPEKGCCCDNQEFSPDSCLVDEFVRKDGFQELNENECPRDSAASTPTAESNIINRIEMSASNCGVSIPECSDVPKRHQLDSSYAELAEAKHEKPYDDHGKYSDLESKMGRYSARSSAHSAGDEAELIATVKTGVLEIIHRIESSLPECDVAVSVNPDVPKIHRRDSFRMEITEVDAFNTDLEGVTQEKMDDDDSGTSDLESTMGRYSARSSAHSAGDVDVYDEDEFFYDDEIYPQTALTDMNSNKISSPERRSRFRYFTRVIRTSIPLQVLMLALLSAASLVPTVEDDYSCLVVNNLIRSFDPILNFPHGPPPI